MAINNAELNSSYIKAKTDAELKQQLALDAEQVLEAAKAELAWNISKGITNPNDKSSLAPFQNIFANFQSEYNLAESFQRFKGQELISANLHTFGLA